MFSCQLAALWQSLAINLKPGDVFVKILLLFSLSTPLFEFPTLVSLDFCKQCRIEMAAHGTSRLILLTTDPVQIAVNGTIEILLLGN